MFMFKVCIYYTTQNELLTMLFFSIKCLTNLQIVSNNHTEEFINVHCNTADSQMTAHRAVCNKLNRYRPYWLCSFILQITWKLSFDDGFRASNHGTDWGGCSVQPFSARAWLFINGLYWLIFFCFYILINAAKFFCESAMSL